MISYKYKSYVSLSELASISKKPSIKKSYSFHDFKNLILKGSIQFLSYGTFASKNPNSLRLKRRKMIHYHYSQINK